MTAAQGRNRSTNKFLQLYYWCWLHILYCLFNQTSTEPTEYLWYPSLGIHCILYLKDIRSSIIILNCSNKDNNAWACLLQRTASQVSNVARPLGLMSFILSDCLMDLEPYKTHVSIAEIVYFLRKPFFLYYCSLLLHPTIPNHHSGIHLTSGKLRVQISAATDLTP